MSIASIAEIAEMQLAGLAIKDGPATAWAAHGVIDPRDLVVCNAGDTPFVVERRTRAGTRTDVVAPGALWLHPAGAPMQHRVHGAGRFVCVRVAPAATRALAGAAHVELRDTIGASAPELAHLVQALAAEARAANPNGPAFVHALFTALWGGLVRRFAAQPRPETRGTLTAARRDAVLALIDARVADGAGLTVAELAAAAGLSPYHFTRAFKAATGASPHQLVMRRRAERARLLLLGPRPDLARVAIDAGYSDQSHLTRELRRHFGVTPRAFVRARR